MPTYWLLSPYTFSADAPVHGGVTVKTLQGNLTCVLENSGYDYDIRPFDALCDTINVDTTWTWSDEIDPILVPVYPSMSGGWRSYTIDVHAQAATRNATLRFYLLETADRPAIDSATGLVAGSTAYKDITITVADARVSDTVADVLPGGVFGDGLLHDVAWLHIAGLTTVAADTVKVRAIRVQEGA